MLTTDLTIALRALGGRKLRSLLTVTSIFVGAFAVVLSSSLAESGLATLMRSVEELGGARMILVVPKRPERARDKLSSARPGLSAIDRDLIAAETPHLSASSLYASLGRRDLLSDGGKRSRADLVAADAEFFSVFGMRLSTGRLLGAEDERRADETCVVGPKLARSLFDGNAVGRRLSAGTLRCRVVGVLADNARWGMNFGFDWNELVVVPHRTALDHEPAVPENSAIALSTSAPVHNEVIKRIANARLGDRRGGVDDFQFYDLGRVVRRFESAFVLMKLLVGLAAAIALVIGGVGVMNMMLVSVSERVREIGIRKAIGATPRDLSRQFLVEATLLSLLGGVSGVVAGTGAAALSGSLIRSAISSWITRVSLPAALAALALSLVIGIAFGWFPAKRAAALDPVEAIRR